MADEITEAAARRAARPAPAADVFAELLDASGLARGASSTWNVYRAWHTVNGDIERAATCGLYVKKASRPGAGDVLIVYVDTRGRATDFNANREVYLARLASAGMVFSEVRFLQSKRPRKEPAQPPRAAAPAPAAPSPSLPELSDPERAAVADAVSALPKSLRESVSKAMEASLRREKAL